MCRESGGIACFGAKHELRVRRRFVWVVDTGEPGDLAGTRLAIQALRIAGLAHLDRRVDEDLDERQPGDIVRRVALARVRARYGEMSGTRATSPGIGEQPGDLADATDVLVAIGGGEPEIGVQPVAQVVAVEQVRGLA